MFGELYLDGVTNTYERGAFAIICYRGVDGNIADVYGETVEDARQAALHIIQAVNHLDGHEESATTREELGQLVREIWVDYCLETGDTKPSHVASWEELNEGGREVDMRIGELLFNVGRRAGINAAIKHLRNLA